MAVFLFISLVAEIRSRRKVSLLFRIKWHVQYSASTQQTSLWGMLSAEQRAHTGQVGSGSYGHASLAARHSTGSLETLVFFDTLLCIESMVI